MELNWGFSTLGGKQSTYIGYVTGALDKAQCTTLTQLKKLSFFLLHPSTPTCLITSSWWVVVPVRPPNGSPWWLHNHLGVQVQRSGKQLSVWARVKIWYIVPSHHFLKSVLSFFRFWYISKCHRFLKSVLLFSKSQLNFQKIETARILLSINLDC